MRKGVVEDISHEGLRALLREERVSFQAIKTWKESNDPDFELKKDRILELYDLATERPRQGRAIPTSSSATTSSGRSTSSRIRGAIGPSAIPAVLLAWPRRRRRATYIRPHGVRHVLAAYDLSTDKLYGHVKTKNGRVRVLGLLAPRAIPHPPQVRIAIVLDNFSTHLSTKTDTRVGDRARANNVELAYSPHYASWLNRI